ncbi:MAG: hypothetical protein ABIJ39_08600 [Chloroflexota bacterium]
MQFVKDRFTYLFNSTKGLILVAIAMIALETALFGMLSGPMAELGVRDVVVKAFNMDMVQAEREGRIIILYHSIAMAVVAIEVYMITGLIAMKAFYRTASRVLITIGYLFAMVFGMGFAYWGHNWALHGLYIAGLTLIFFSGVLLAIGLWPWEQGSLRTDKAYAVTRKGLDLERATFFTMALATLASALFGAVPGSYFGNGFETFLAENIIRQPHKTLLEDSIIGHLHIMLTLIAIAITLIVGRWLDFKGILHKIAMPLMIIGTIVISIGAWSVIFVAWAHTIIYVGSVMVMLPALFLVIFGWDKFIREGVAGIQKPTGWQKLKALLRDPLRFGPLWQMVFMNFTVSGVGIFMAVKLDEIIRVLPWREERITLTGHWHILSAIIATIILFYYGDMIGLKGKLRQWYGWSIIILSDIAFGAVTLFELKRLFVSEAEQQPLVNILMLLADFGLGMLLVILAMVMIWRMLDLFRKKGRWTLEREQEDLSTEVK